MKNQQVYVVMCDEQDDSSTLVGVFTTLDKAEAEAKRWSKGRSHLDLVITGTNLR